MIKTIIKEVIIVLLALLAISLLFGVLFYEYIPTNKVVPSKVQSYLLTDDIKEELNTDISMETQNIIKTYSIDATDLKLYEDTSDYDKGKVNPFAIINTQTDNTIENSTNNTTTFFNTIGK